MQFFILVLVLCLFVFLYSVYVLARDDFIFLRRDLTMEKIFNIIFAGSLSSLFFARLFYGLIYLRSDFLSPFVFFLVPYYPGLSLVGGVIGTAITFLFLSRNKKNSLPLARLADFFSIAFLITLPIGILGYFMFSEGELSFVKTTILVVVYLLLFAVFLRFLFPVFLSGKIKEGTITLIFLACFSLVNLVSNAFPITSVIDYFKNFENPILMIAFAVSLFFLIKQENLLSKIKEFRIKRKK